MSLKRQTALQLALLAVAMTALVILSVAGPAACAPANPDGQASGQAEAEDATAEPTATATTAAANTPATATATPTPNPKLDSILNIWAQGYAAQQSSGPGASGQSASSQSATQKTIAVQIAPQTAGQRGDVTDFLESNGIAHTTVVGNVHIRATVPVSLLAILTALPSVGRIKAKPFPYPNASGVNILIAEYEAGLLPGEDANPTFALLAIGIEGDANYDAVKRYLENNSAVMFYTDPEIDDTYKPMGLLPVYVPVAHIAPVAQMAGVYDITLYVYPVPAEHRVTQPPLLVPATTSTPTPTAAARGGTSPSRDGVTGAGITPPTATPAARRSSVDRLRRPC